LGNAVAVSFAKAGAKGVVLMDIQGPEVLAEGAKNVESQGVAVGYPKISINCLWEYDRYRGS
jgi:predicted nicotinamide N-methyase